MIQFRKYLKYKLKEKKELNIYVCRHGQTDYNKLNMYQGQSDILLNDVGLEQAKEMAVSLKNITNKIDYIISSPLKRAVQTAEAVSEIFNVNIDIYDGIKERGFGKLEGNKPTPKLTNQMMLDYEKNYNLDNIEPIKDFFARVYTALDSIVEKYVDLERKKGKEINLVIVTHAAVTIAIDCYFVGTPDVMNYETLEPRVLKNAQIKMYDVLNR